MALSIIWQWDKWSLLALVRLDSIKYNTRNEDLTFTFSLNCLVWLEDRCLFHRRRSQLLLLAQPLSSLLVQRQQLTVRSRAVEGNSYNTKMVRLVVYLEWGWYITPAREMNEGYLKIKLPLGSCQFLSHQEPGWPILLSLPLLHPLPKHHQ